MGFWGTGLYSNDTTEDIKDAYIFRLKEHITTDYDAWGNLLGHTTDSVRGNILYNRNIYTYRGEYGYFYERYSGTYYLKTRFYDSQVGRFISPDDTNYIDLSGLVLGCNVFIYCENNFVNSIDPEGKDWKTIILGGISIVLSVLSWFPWFKVPWIIASIGIVTLIMVCATVDYNNDLLLYKKMLNQRKITQKQYNNFVYNCKLAYYFTVASCVISAFCSVIGLCFRNVVLPAALVIVNVLGGFSFGNLSWVIDVSYTLSYRSLKKRLKI